MKIKAVKPRAEINLKMYDCEEKATCKTNSTGTGEDCMILIANYIVEVSRGGGFSYKTYLVHLIEMCNKLVERKERNI